MQLLLPGVKTQHISRSRDNSHSRRCAPTPPLSRGWSTVRPGSDDRPSLTAEWTRRSAGQCPSPSYQIVCGKLDLSAKDDQPAVSRIRPSHYVHLRVTWSRRLTRLVKFNRTQLNYKALRHYSIYVNCFVPLSRHTIESGPCVSGAFEIPEGDGSTALPPASGGATMVVADCKLNRRLSCLQPRFDRCVEPRLYCLVLSYIVLCCLVLSSVVTYTVLCCHVLSCVVMCCRGLSCVVVGFHELSYVVIIFAMSCHELHVVCCQVLPCVIMCYHVFSCVVMCCHAFVAMFCHVLSCVAMWWIGLILLKSDLCSFPKSSFISECVIIRLEYYCTALFFWFGVVFLQLSVFTVLAIYNLVIHRCDVFTRLAFKSVALYRCGNHYQHKSLFFGQRFCAIFWIYSFI